MSPTPLSAPPERAFRPLWRRPAGWALVALFLICAALALYLQAQHMKAYKEEMWVDTFVLPKPEYVEKVALGYNAWFADFLFLRAIQAFGGTSSSSLRKLYEAVYNYFDAIAALDPHFLYIYDFGTLVIGDQGGSYKLALKFLEKGQWENWRRYTPWEQAAFTKINGMKEHDNVAKYFVRQAAKTVDATVFVSHWENYIDEQNGEYRMAVERWLRVYAQDYDARNNLYPSSWRRIEGIIGDWHKAIVQNAADKYQKDKGVPARDTDQLVKGGYFGPVSMVNRDKLAAAVDPFNLGGAKLTPHVDKILESATENISGVPPCLTPAGTRWTLAWNSIDKQMIAATEADREALLRDTLNNYREYLKDFHAKNKAYPKTIEGLIFPSMKVPLLDPYGGDQFDYNPQTGEVRSRNRPEL